MKKRLLIIEDEFSVAKQLKWGLAQDYDITIASGVDTARKALASGTFPVATMDLGLPPHPDVPIQGFKLLEELPSLAPQTRIIIISGNTEKENAIRAIAMGAADFCTKPIDLKVLRIILERTFKIQDLEETNRRLQTQAGQSGTLCGMLGISPAMTTLFERLIQVARTNYPALITGSTGTGKEMAANAIHQLSPRAANPLVIINCGAIPENLLESELFGHEKGAFTGATALKIGRFEQADQGTIFLDEIGELPLSLQVKILRFLQESTIERLGGTATITLDVRIIAATNTNLEEAIEKSEFREDLFYRLNVVPLTIPNLRDRPEDILLLANTFLREESRKLKRGQTSFSPAAVAALAAHQWPGNVRELQNRVRRALGTSLDRLITPVDLGLEETSQEPEGQRLTTLKAAREEAEKDAIAKALAWSGSNISQAAKLLDISRPTLHDLLKKHRISIDK